MKNHESLACGGFFIAVGFVYGASALMSLPMGSAVSMGPGYFPTVLSGLLVVLGIAIVIRGSEAEDAILERVPWRAVLMLSLAVILFAVLLRSLGLFLTVFLTAFIGCLASREATVLKAAMLGVGLAVLCALIFSFGIGLPIPLFGSWLGGS